jgi:hypothetical protein
MASNQDDYINTITLGSVTHNSQQGESGYTYYTTPNFSFTPGGSVSVSLSPFNDKNRNFWRIWIDFNNDGDFEDTGETVFTANNKKGTVSGSINIPAGVDFESPDRMRITMKTGGAPTACETNFNGEVEDYDIYYIGDEFFSPVTGDIELTVYPNPADNLLNLRVNQSSVEVYIRIYNFLGEIVADQVITNGTAQLDISNLSSGLYFIHGYNSKQKAIKKFIIK